MSSLSRRSLIYIGNFVLISTVFLFFAFHTIAGERGLLARNDIDRDIRSAQEELALIDKQNHFLENRIRLLRSGAIDADMLAETARAEVGLYSKNDVIITIDMDNLK